MKKIILSTVLLTVITACTSSQTTTQNSSTKSNEETTKPQEVDNQKEINLNSLSNIVRKIQLQPENLENILTQLPTEW